MIVAGKHNTYSVIDKCEDGEHKWFKLKCIDFYDIDDLGDKIMCRRLGDEIWIANYHFRHMSQL